MSGERSLDSRWENFAKSLSKEWTADQIAGAKTAYYAGATAALAEVAHFGAMANSAPDFVDGVTARIQGMNDEIREYMAGRRRRS